MFTFYSDPGHSWLAVTLQDVIAVGLAVSDFSRYSYRKNNTLFLEEDCDAGKFILAYEAIHGARPEFKEVYQERTFIRSLPHI